MNDKELPIPIENWTQTVLITTDSNLSYRGFAIPVNNPWDASSIPCVYMFGKKLKDSTIEICSIGETDDSAGGDFCLKMIEAANNKWNALITIEIEKEDYRKRVVKELEKSLGIDNGITIQQMYR